MRNNAFIDNYPPYLKLVSLVFIVIVTLLFTLLLAMLVMVPFFGIDVIENLSAYTNTSDPANLYLLKYFQIASQFGMFIFPVIIFAYLANWNIPRYLQLNISPGTIVLIVSGVIMFVALPVINWMVEVNESLALPDWLSWMEQWMKESERKAMELTDAFLNTTTVSGLAVNLLMMAVIPAIGEEFLFRGVLMRLFREWFRNVHFAIIVSAVLFSALHLQFYGFLPRMILGVLFGYLFIWTGSLWVPIFAHFINNAGAVVVAYLAARDIIDTDYESFGASENHTFIIISFIIVALLLVFVRFYRNRSNI